MLTNPAILSLNPPPAGQDRPLAGRACQPPCHAMGQIVFKELPEEPSPRPGAFRGARALRKAAAQPTSSAGPSAATARSARGRQHKIAELYREYGPFVYRRCLRLLKHPDAARDATQEVFVKLVRDIGKLEGRASGLPWLYRVATNHCLNHVRHQNRSARDMLQSLEIQSLASEHPYPERILVHAILSRFDVATQAIAVGVFVD